MGLIKKVDKEKQQEVSASQVVPATYGRVKHYEDDSVELDAIERLKSNILMLDDLQKRLGFMNSEIEKVIGARNK